MQTEMIQHIVGPLSQVDAEEYLESLETLALELDRAMQAVAAKALPSFEDSLRAQRAVCAKLSEFPRRAAARRAQNDGADEPPVDAELAERIKTAATTLLLLNKSYSALLKHSGDTLRLFAGLFRSYSGPTQHAATVRVNHRTWSCEL
ncbi:hypothetical protein [Granulicella sibirica]|uniref:Uncharacterized protein n=1 Tax=Granulicella sibirica TaxID=2479048 RepID=A0A4Q0T3Z4_9BACT|nr:hypothetical protein [Granulicella sibirica]RXH57250.1 hypothetical protein GRAN_0560 [Granulicella sibirica]